MTTWRDVIQHILRDVNSLDEPAYVTVLDRGDHGEVIQNTSMPIDRYSVTNQALVVESHSINLPRVREAG